MRSAVLYASVGVLMVGVALMVGRRLRAAQAALQVPHVPEQWRWVDLESGGSYSVDETGVAWMSGVPGEG